MDCNVLQRGGEEVLVLNKLHANEVGRGHSSLE